MKEVDVRVRLVAGDRTLTRELVGDHSRQDVQPPNLGVKQAQHSNWPR